MFKKIIKPTILLILITFIFSGCSLSLKKKNTSPEPEKQEQTEENVVVAKTGKLKKFSDYTELNNFLANNTSNQSVTAEVELEPAFKLDYFQDNPSDDNRSADILKQADGFAFALVKDQVAVFRLDGDNNSLLTKIDFTVRPSGLLLFEKSLVVYGVDEAFNTQKDGSFNFVKVFNLSAPSSPRLIQDLSFEGGLKDIFIENGRLYLITESLANSDNKPLARVFSNNELLAETCDGIEKCFSPEVFYFDTDYNRNRFLNINVVNLENEFSPISGQAYLLNNNHQVFNSGSSIFISFLETLNEGPLYFAAQKALIYDRLSSVEQEKVKEFEALSEFVLSANEKISKISVIFNAYLQNLPQTEKTLLEFDIKAEVEKQKSTMNISNKTKLHKISLGKDKIDYYAVAEFVGDIFNNYSLLEKDNYIYLGSRGEEKLNDDGEKRYYVSIYVFDQALKLVGKMENLSSKEKIYGIKFIGDRAFLVSGQKDGSIFVINLKDKKKPEFAGTLKIPGKSVYLKPIDKNGEKFISFSYSLNTEAGTEVVNGLKLSLFDFSDLKSPKEADSYLIGDINSESLVFADKDSFFYSDTSKTLTFPASFKENGNIYFSGYFAFKIAGDSLELKGKLDHSAGGFYNQFDIFNNINYRDNSVKRTFVINNNIYSFTNKFFYVADMNDIEKINKSLDINNHSDDSLVSSFGVGNPEGIGVIDTPNNNSADTINQTESSAESQLSIPTYFEEGASEEVTEVMPEENSIPEVTTEEVQEQTPGQSEFPNDGVSEPSGI